MKKLLIILLLLTLAPSALAISTSENFDYESIKGYAGGHYGEVYTIVGTLIYSEEYHRSSDDKKVEEYAKIAVDGLDSQIVCVHYIRDKNLFPFDAGIQVAVLAYVDGVQRVGKVIVPLMEANSRPLALNEE